MKLNRIISLMLSLSLVLSFAGCKKDEPKKDEKANIETSNSENIKEEDIYEGLIEKAPDETTQNKTEILNEGNGPVNIESGDELVSKIDEFNTLLDGDPKKEEIRKELEDLFKYAEGETFEN